MFQSSGRCLCCCHFVLVLVLRWVCLDFLHHYCYCACLVGRTAVPPSEYWMVPGLESEMLWLTEIVTDSPFLLVLNVLMLKLGQCAARDFIYSRETGREKSSRYKSYSSGARAWCHGRLAEFTPFSRQRNRFYLARFVRKIKKT